MSDHCYTQKNDYRNTILPKNKSNWELLSESGKSKHLNVNGYIFVGYIFLLH